MQRIKLLYDEGYTIKGAQNTLKKRSPMLTGSRPEEALQSLKKQTLQTDVYLDKAEAMLEEANKHVTRLLENIGH